MSRILRRETTLTSGEVIWVISLLYAFRRIRELVSSLEQSANWNSTARHHHHLSSLKILKVDTCSSFLSHFYQMTRIIGTKKVKWVQLKTPSMTKFTRSRSNFHRFQNDIQQPITI